MEYGNLILANTKKGFIQQAIKWFTKSQFSHSFVTMPDILDIPMCIEACEGGVDMCRFDKGYVNDTNQAYEVWALNISQDIKDQALKQIMNDLETGYGFLEYPWFIWRRLNLLVGKDIKAHNNWNSSGIICSQLCVAYLTACGLAYLFDGYGKGSIAPQDLQNIFIAYPELFTKTFVKN